MTTPTDDLSGRVPVNSNPTPAISAKPATPDDVRMSQITKNSFPTFTPVEIQWLNLDDEDKPKQAGVRSVVWIEDGEIDESIQSKNLILSVIDRICTAVKSVFKHLFENNVKSSVAMTREVLGCSKQTVAKFEEVLKKHKDTLVEVDGEVKTVAEVYQDMIHNIAEFRDELSTTTDNSQLFDLVSLKNDTLEQVINACIALKPDDIQDMSTDDQKVWSEMMKMLVQSFSAGNHQIHTDGMRFGILDLHYQEEDLVDPNFPEKMQERLESTNKSLETQQSGIYGRYARALQARIIEPFHRWKENKVNEREKGFSSLFEFDYPKGKAVWEKVRYNSKEGITEATRKVSFLSENGGITEAKVKINFHDVIPSLSELESIKFMDFITNIQAIISKPGTAETEVKQWIVDAQKQGYNDAELIQNMPESLKSVLGLFDFATDSNKILLVRKALNFVYDISCAMTSAQLTSAPAVKVKSNEQVSLVTYDLAQKSLSTAQTQNPPDMQTSPTTRKYVQIDDNDIPVDMIVKTEKKGLFKIIAGAVSAVKQLFGGIDSKIDRAVNDMIEIMGLSNPESLEKAAKLKELLKKYKDGLITCNDGSKLTVGQAVFRMVALVSKLRSDVSSGKDEKLFDTTSNPNASELKLLVTDFALNGDQAVRNSADHQIITNFLNNFSQFGEAGNLQNHTDSTLIGILDLHYRFDDLVKPDFVEAMRAKLKNRKGAFERALNTFVGAAEEWQNNQIPEEKGFFTQSDYLRVKAVWDDVVYNSKGGLVLATRIIAYKKQNGNVSEAKVKLNLIKPILTEEESIKFMEFVTAIETISFNDEVKQWLNNSRDPAYSDEDLLNQVPEELKVALQKLDFASGTDKELLLRKAVDFVYDMTVAVTRAQVS